MRRFLPAIAVLAVMALFGLGVYSVLGTLKSNKHHSQKPTQTKALIDLPGTVYVVQNGSIYSLNDLTFTELKAPPDDWVQVEPGPNGDILAVAYSSMYSAVYQLSPQGAVIHELLSESSSQYFDNHWAYYPRVSPNGNTLFYAWDWYEPGNQYNVDFQIQSVPLSDPSANATIWSESDLFYQGGDVEPIPLANGGLIYTKYDINDQSSSPDEGDTYGQLAYASSPGAVPTFLTTAAEDCGEPALSPSGSDIAMVCTNNTFQTTTLDVASWNGTTLGTPVPIANGPLPASPTWSPDGKNVLYLNTLLTDKSSPFQLWWVPDAAAKKPGVPQQVTQDLNFTATSPPVWTS
jgi:hypothetical protein